MGEKGNNAHEFQIAWIASIFAIQIMFSFCQSASSFQFICAECSSGGEAALAFPAGTSWLHCPNATLCLSHENQDFLLSVPRSTMSPEKLCFMCS